MIMQIIKYMFFMLILSNQKLLSQDSLILSKDLYLEYNWNVDDSNSGETFKLLEDKKLFQGYFIFEFEKDFRIDTIGLMKDRVALKCLIYFIAKNSNQNSGNLNEKFYLYKFLEIFRHSVFNSYKSLSGNNFNSFVYFYYLFNKFNNKSCTMYLYEINSSDIFNLINSKKVFIKDNKYCIILYNSFFTAIFKDLENKNYFIPISHLEESSDISNEDINRLNVQETDMKLFIK